ncbi:hypothetical protein [Caldivirga maquilingensis]|uniref:Uncharacterized protein n=1 Tax=Caldivirga maquilingensis (strain ATCC 700844 / DSM 13496 / JCM 10307 / IC-167) TaxID=397948 RepID=A8MCJ1_CALMQ|nr:hypothetical protein [Caldivirga maquilingensis]ABW01497.1 hypothetical protein Cmaq_0657 [Caldivirga maquilingensis IC-167]
MSRARGFRSIRSKELVCFFCLRTIKPSEAKVVVINDELIGMNFKVIACSECAAKYGESIRLKAS